MDAIFDIFAGIDFSSPVVQLLSVVFVLATSLVLLVVFIGLGLFIPKSKRGDLAAVEKAISRLKALMLFDRVAFCCGLALAAVLAVLHITAVADVFEPPLIWFTLIDALLLPILAAAVLGGGRRYSGRNANRRKLEQLLAMREQLRGRPGSPR